MNVLDIRRFILNLKNKHVKITLKDESLIIEAEDDFFDSEDYLFLVNNKEAIKNFYRNEIFENITSKEDAIISGFTNKNISKSDLELLLLKYDVEDIIELSPVQLSILPENFHDKSELNLIQFSYRIVGDVNILILKQSFEEIVKHFDVLRSLFVRSNSNIPLQIILKEHKVDFSFYDLSNEYVVSDYEALTERFVQKDREKGFDLTNDILFRVTFLKIDDLQYSAILSSHKLLIDSSGFRILMDRLVNIYLLLLSREEINLKKSFQFKQYRECIANKCIFESEQFWFDYLRDVNGFTDLAQFRKKDAILSKYEKGDHLVFLDEQQEKAIDQFCEKYQIRYWFVFLSIWGLILSLLNNKDKICLGFLGSATLREIRLCHSIGPFINLIPINIHFNKSTRVLELLQHVGSLFVECNHNNHISFERINQINSDRFGLIDSVLGVHGYYLENNEQLLDSQLQKNSINLDNVEFHETINYNLFINLTITERIGISFQYNRNIYSDEFVMQLGEYFKTIFSDIVTKKDLPISEINLM